MSYDLHYSSYKQLYPHSPHFFLSLLKIIMQKCTACQNATKGKLGHKAHTPLF